MIADFEIIGTAGDTEEKHVSDKLIDLRTKRKHLHKKKCRCPKKHRRRKKIGFIPSGTIKYITEMLYHTFAIHSIISMANKNIVKIPKEIIETSHNVKDYYHVRLVEQFLILKPEFPNYLRIKNIEYLRIIRWRAHLSHYKYN